MIERSVTLLGVQDSYDARAAFMRGGKVLMASFLTKNYKHQAAGKPIICCAEGRPAEYVRGAGSDLTVKPGDYEALAKAVIYLRENIDVAEKLGKSGRQYVGENLSIERIGLRMKEILALTLKR